MPPQALRCPLLEDWTDAGLADGMRKLEDDIDSLRAEGFQVAVAPALRPPGMVYWKRCPHVCRSWAFKPRSSTPETPEESAPAATHAFGGPCRDSTRPSAPRGGRNTTRGGFTSRRWCADLRPKPQIGRCASDLLLTRSGPVSGRRQHYVERC